MGWCSVTAASRRVKVESKLEVTLRDPGLNTKDLIVWWRLSSSGMSSTNDHHHPLETVPTIDVRQPQGRIPNTPLAASTVSFSLGCIFALGLLSFTYSPSRIPYQLGFYLASWAFFHWAEFSVTAGWNREKCSVDCT